MENEHRTRAKLQSDLQPQRKLPHQAACLPILSYCYVQRQTLKCHNATHTSASFQRNRSWRRNFPPDSHMAIFFTFCTLLSQITPCLEGTSSHFEQHTASQNSLSRIHMMCYFSSTVYFKHNPAEQAV